MLAERVLAHPRIDVAEDERVLDALARRRALRRRRHRRAARSPARATLLATGGYAALWERTTNPRGAIGEGIALAYRAGAALADLEFVQFHPTALVDAGFLLSEALRGEGARAARRATASRFTDELAPRDVVARAIAERGTRALDLRAIERGRFPALMATLVRGGLRPRADEPIPVSPAAHYTVGGIVTDLDGRSDVARASTPPASAPRTGVHGANRLASNSLLECLVFGRRAALAALGEPAAAAAPARDAGSAGGRARRRAELRRGLWHDAGLIRDAAGLERLLTARRTAAAARRRERAHARARAAASHFRADFPTEERRLRARTSSSDGAREPELEAWS